MTERHAGRLAFVTGAGSGIGRAIARRLATEGCAVACTDVQLGRARETADAIVDRGGRALALEADVRNRAAVRSALQQTVAAWRGLNYVVNNAGIVTMSSLANVTDEEWDLVVDINLKGQFIVTQEAAPLLAPNTPSAIVNLSTVEAEVVVSSSGFAQPHYNASKGGVKMLTKACAVELAAQGTRVNAVAPGPVQTGFIPGVDPEHFEMPQIVLDRLLIKRMGQPDDVAAAVSFLLSDDASFITGAQLVVDGGWLAR
ncbi:MAG TPA: SDR family NAD(P)-dependent oxidoreductase [Candidatus Acidoferrales bacterium]|nr:SDR family NAD(P)-dependent oxidoreductase [Candidatus Acidoferrales bacterium]